MGLGTFAGGLASGATQGMQLYRMGQDEKRRQDEFEREQGKRREAANAFGNVGQQREDGSAYSEENAYADYAKNVARYDPEASMRARGEGLRHKSAQRQERYANAEEQFLDFQRRMVNADDQTYFREAAKFATSAVPDGKSFGVEFDPQGGGAVGVMVADGQVLRQPIKTRDELNTLLASYVSPGMYRQEQELGLKRQATAADTQRAGAAEKTAAAAQQNADRMRDFYAPGGVYERTHGASVRAQMSMNNRGFTPAGKLEDGTPVAFNQNRGVYVNALDGRALSGDQVKLFQKITGEKPTQPESLGNTGLIRVGNDLYTQDMKDPTKLVRVQVPGASIIDRLRAQGQGGQGGQGGMPQRPGAAPQRGPSFGLNMRTDVGALNRRAESDATHQEFYELEQALRRRQMAQGGYR